MFEFIWTSTLPVLRGIVSVHHISQLSTSFEESQQKQQWQINPNPCRFPNHPNYYESRMKCVFSPFWYMCKSTTVYKVKYIRKAPRHFFTVRLGEVWNEKDFCFATNMHLEVRYYSSLTGLLASQLFNLMGGFCFARPRLWQSHCEAGPSGSVWEWKPNWRFWVGGRGC